METETSSIEAESGKTVDLESVVKTEVTSIAKEEERTGQKIPIPNAEELVQRASLSLVRSLQQIDFLISSKDPIKKLSNRSIKRALLAGLQLPTDGLPVMLRRNEEKLLFGLIQRIISDRFIILQHHISQEIKKERKKNEQQSEGEIQPEGKQKEIQKEDSNETVL